MIRKKNINKKKFPSKAAIEFERVNASLQKIHYTVGVSY